MIHIQIRLDDNETGAMSWRAVQGGARWKRARNLETVIHAADKEYGAPTADDPREIDYVADIRVAEDQDKK
jgi:hypothetical protein